MCKNFDKIIKYNESLDEAGIIEQIKITKEREETLQREEEQ